MIVIACIGCSVVVSVITARIVAVRYFGVVDGYVKGIVEVTKDAIERAVRQSDQKMDKKLVNMAKKILRQPGELSKEIESIEDVEKFVNDFINN